MVGNGFPDALPGDVVVRRSARLPNRFRFMPENTLYGQSVCPDEINNEKGDRLRMRKMGCKQGPVCSSVATGLVLTALCISHGFVPADAAPQDRCACKYEGRVLPESVYRRAVFSNAEHKDTAVEVKDGVVIVEASGAHHNVEWIGPFTNGRKRVAGVEDGGLVHASWSQAGRAGMHGRVSLDDGRCQNCRCHNCIGHDYIVMA